MGMYTQFEDENKIRNDHIIIVDADGIKYDFGTFEAFKKTGHYRSQKQAMQDVFAISALIKNTQLDPSDLPCVKVAARLEA